MKTGMHVFSVICLIIVIGSSYCNVQAQDNRMPVIILKLDDITQNGAGGGAISPRWQKVVDLVRKEKIKASFGIIGFSLEDDNEAYFGWIKELDKEGIIEFWNHGYRNRSSLDKKGEFEEGSWETQREALMKTQILAKEKLGISLHVFGPHWTGTNKDTEQAMKSISEIKMWFYGPASFSGSGRYSFERCVNLEQPIFNPNFEAVKRDFDKLAAQKKVIALQGHPNQWDDARFTNFEKLVLYFKSRGCRFMTPSEYYTSAGLNK